MRVLRLLLAGLLAAVLPPSAVAASTVLVRPGDTLAGIAARVGSTPDALARLNGLADPNHVVAGTRLRAAGHAATPSASGTSGASHVVRAGETLASIAAARGTSVAALARANKISDPNLVTVGRVLRFPGSHPEPPSVPSKSIGAAYTVRAGDTLASIAARLGTTAETLARTNNISDPNMIVVGATIRTSASLSGSTGSAPSSGQVAALIDAAAARHGASASLARAVAWQESGWGQRSVSPVGAIGVMQLMPETAAWAGPALLGRSIDPRRVDDNIDAGVAFLAHLVRATGDVPTALAAYNQGLASVRRRGLFKETQQYVASVQALVGRV